jgi:hypothetical protein
MANEIIKGVPQKNILDSLKHRRELLEQAVTSDIEGLLLNCACMTGEVVYLNDLTSAPKAILDYLCNEKFKEELAQVSA